ncbi:hypothetical protein EDM57_08795 [Brevibacillus gelatini]|uniref:Uncharacterized protein n=1 Tax=Brevibacillus gelatini TaxID=1655277 RepID=A0A3M8B4M2_9BACL|nr:hypothetical protein EDM57_08795 [Brevibacillus gelatini]
MSLLSCINDHLLNGKFNHLHKTFYALLEPTTNENIYLLHTTKESPFPDEKYEINIQKKKAVKIK